MTNQDNFQQSEEQLLNLYYCSFEQDPSGKECEELTEELMEEGFSAEVLMKAQADASRLFAKYVR